jgi:hypothetical protein
MDIGSTTEKISQLNLEEYKFKNQCPVFPSLK